MNQSHRVPDEGGSMTAEYVCAGGARLFTRVHYLSGDAPWLVFSNSLMTDHTIWDAQVEHFSSRFNILVYDQRGHGRSEISTDLTFDELSKDVLALLDHYQIAACSFVGLSMGVPTGLGAFGIQPSRFTRLIFSDGQMASQPAARDIWQARIDSARASGMPWVARQTIERWFSPQFVQEGRADDLLERAGAMDVEGYCAAASALRSFDFSSVAAKVTVPLLLLAGANDGLIPSIMQGMADHIPGAEFHIIEGAGHIPNLEQPRDFNRLLAAFLS